MQSQQALRTNAVLRQQMPGVARVLGGNHIHPAQYVQCPQGDVVQIPQRGGHYI